MNQRRLAACAAALALALSLSACAPKDAGPAPTPDIMPTATPVQEVDFFVRMDGTDYHTTPELPLDNSNALGALSKDTALRLVEDQAPFYLVELPDGKQGWVHEWFLSLPDRAAQQRLDEARLADLTAREGYVPLEEEAVYTCMANQLNCRLLPSTQGLALFRLTFGAEVTVLGQEGQFYLCRMPGGGLAYCAADYLSPEATYADVEGAADLRAYLPTADFDLRFSTTDNVTGKALYPAVPLLETSAAEQLVQAQTLFRADGYSLKIFDAYRPDAAQTELYRAIGNTRFAADPAVSRSWHQLGRAVDVTLVDMQTGQELVMPTPVYTFTTQAGRDAAGSWSNAAKANCDYLTEVMESVGFQRVNSEWWHFQYQAQGAYMDPNLDFERLTYRPVADLLPPPKDSPVPEQT